MAKINKYYLSLAGEYRVASELLKRGLNATVTFGHAKSADVITYGSNRRAAVIEVKTSQQKNFVTGFYQKYKTPTTDHPDFWVLAQIRPGPDEDFTEKFFILTHAELAPIQGERNRTYHVRRGSLTPDARTSWEQLAELSRNGVDNILLADVESHEDRWDKIMSFCEH